MKGIIFASVLWLLPTMAFASPVLVELYTSQGCSSCPPADKFAGELTKIKDVIVLTLPVTYWDRLGWKDSLASPKFTRRQRAYARTMGARQVYTPQMVIDGTFHVVGSSKRKVYNLIKKRKQQNQNAPRVFLEKNNQGWMMTLPQTNLAKPLVLWRVDFIKERSVTIGSGENGGSTITYHHVARTLEPLRSWNGKSHTETLKQKAGTDGVVIFLQEANHGKVLASTIAQRR